MMLPPHPDYIVDRSHPDPDRRKIRWGLALTLAASVGLIATILLS